MLRLDPLKDALRTPYQEDTDPPSWSHPGGTQPHAGEHRIFSSSTGRHHSCACDIEVCKRAADAPPAWWRRGNLTRFLGGVPFFHFLPPPTLHYFHFFEKYFLNFIFSIKKKTTNIFFGQLTQHWENIILYNQNFIIKDNLMFK